MKHTFLALTYLLLAVPTAGWAAEPAAQPAANTPIPPDTNLPIAQVALYTSGVGYFERSGTVDGDARESLLFPVDQVNDILKSLVLLDTGGGQIEPVTFAAQDSVTKQLQAFSVDLSDNPDRAALLNRVRGARVRVTSGTSAVDGTIVGVENHDVQLPNGGGTTTQTQTLTLMTAAGLQAFDLASISSVQFLDPSLDSEIRAALAAVAQGRDASRRAVVLDFTGHGRRNVAVGYVTATPLWQTSYRLVMGEHPQIQGWATVQNTGQDDWNNVRLSLVSGRPVSFIQDMYTPVYVPRPIIQSQIAGAPGPQLYDGNLQAGTSAANGATATGAIEAPAATPPAPSEDAASPVSVARAQTSTMFNVTQHDKEEMAAAGVAQSVATSGAQLGTALFSYDIQVPVSVPRMQSAMIPFLAAPLQARSVSIYNPDVLSDHPMTGARLVNTTKMHLMGGPVTVFEQGSGASSGYVGDAEIEDTEPGQTRLLSFAVDLAVDCDEKPIDQAGETRKFSINRGILNYTVKSIVGTAYTFKNNAAESRLIVLERPFSDGDNSGDSYKLVEPAQATEKTVDRYRFDIPVAAGASKEFTVREERTDYQAIGLVDGDASTFAAFAQEGGLSPAVRAALQEVIHRRRAIADIQEDIDAAKQQIDDIGQGQDRIRKNMAALDKSSPLYKRYASELDTQETQLNTLNAKLDSLNIQLAAQKSDLSSYLDNLNAELKYPSVPLVQCFE